MFNSAKIRSGLGPRAKTPVALTSSRGANV